MHRWHRTASNLCCLCQSVQTNKHVLSNCSFPGSLARYSDRHNSILTIIYNYLKSTLPFSTLVYVDLPNSNPINILFNNLRPDLAVLYLNKIVILELTVCHETNLAAAKLRKLNKYRDLKQNLNPPFSHHDIKIATLEVSVLGFISDLNPFLKLLKITRIPQSILNKISLAAIDHSKSIYHSRDNSDI